MRTFSHLSRALLGTLSTSLVLVGAQAQTLSQTPLLTTKTVVEPNVVLALDTSGSMESQFSFRYGGDEGWNGRNGPANVADSSVTGTGWMSATCSGTFSITATCTYRKPWTTGSAPANDRWYFLSPDINSLTYDPRIRYKLRVNSAGVPQIPGSTTASAAAVTTSTDPFYVYFYKNGTTNLNEVWKGKISNSSGTDQLWSTTNKNYTYAPHRSPLDPTAYFTPSITQAQFGSAAASQLMPGSPAKPYPNKVDGSTTEYPRFVGRTDCNGGAETGGVCSYDEEKLNYAIWKKYHSNRLDLVKTGLGWAFDQIGPSLRLGWGTIFDMKKSTPTLGTGVSLFNSTTKGNFYDWLYSRPSTWDGTPSLKALETMGNYYSRSDNKGPWADTPDASSTGATTLSTSAGDTNATRKTHLSCRRSYGMLITDGYYDGTTSVGNVDSTASSTITGTMADGTALTYTYNGSTRPYSGGGSNTMADIIMKYWVTDLRPGTTDGIENKVKKIDDVVAGSVIVKRGNESFWQNMSFYGVGLGVVGTLDQTEGAAGSVLENIRNNVANTNNVGTSVTGWPTAAAFQEEAMDDMWHATINGRGRLLSAKNTDTLSDGVEGMLADIVSVTDSQSGVAASTASLITGTRKYSPLFTTGSWTGNIVATFLDKDTSADICVLWKITGTVDTSRNLMAPACTLTADHPAFITNQMPPAASRNIYAWNGSAYGNFDENNTHVQTNVTGGTNADLIKYLRGDQSKEDTATITNSFRARESIMGDIVNSTPTLVKGALDAGYANLPPGTLGQASYKAYLVDKGNREGILFAGANDGMLHGFRDTTGAEVFAFVPRAVMPNLHLLSQRIYGHKYYVDGPTTEVDACLGTPNKNCAQNEWRNLLLGALGAGGKSIYAIDVTTVNDSLPTMGLGASNILWEITTTNYPKLGHIFSEIQTGVTTGGKWVAVFGNGYYSADGSAHLYVADLTTGAKLMDIDTGVTGGNGLSAVTLVRDATMRIIGAYAGDLKGNLWKFDLSDSNETNWKLAESVGGAQNGKLFVPSTGARAITAPPAYVPHPNGGRVVVFGTGKFFDSEDATTVPTPPTQGFKGIWDSVDFGVAMPTTVMQIDNTLLVQQTITGPTTETYLATNYNTGSAVTQTMTFSAFKQSKNPIDWATKRGWYMEIPSAFPGERLIYPMVRLFSEKSRLVMANTLAMSTTSACTSDVAGSGHSYIFDLLTGARPDQSLIPGCTDCTITPTPPVPPVVICNGANCFALTPTGDGKNGDQCLGSMCTPPLKPFCGSQTGLPCATTVKRSWRQLFMR